MAHSAKGAGNMLVPLAVVAVAVTGAIAATLAFTGEEPPAQPTVIPEEAGVERPAGAGTNPEGLADETLEGVTDQLEEVDPIAPGVESIPAADLETYDGPDDWIVGETAADENTADNIAGEPVLAAIDPAEAGEPDASSDEGIASEETDFDADLDAATIIDDEAVAVDGDTPETDVDAEGPILDAGSATAVDDIGVVDPEVEDYPAGRDARTELTPEEGQDVVRDTDEGGAPFVPTASGPEGRDNETIFGE